MRENITKRERYNGVLLYVLGCSESRVAFSRALAFVRTAPLLGACYVFSFTVSEKRNVLSLKGTV